MISAIRNSTHLGVKIRVPASASASADARPINLALLIDTSGSMEGERLDAVKKTLAAARQLFIPTDTLTMVTFADRATVVADHVSPTEFYVAVDTMHAQGSTNLSAGIEQLLLLQNSNSPYDAILVLTDGLINAGIVSSVGLRTMMIGLGSIPITALGYGADHNRILLRDMATRSRGAYIYVDSESVLPLAMGDMIGGLRTEAFKDTTLRVPTGWTCCENDEVSSSYRLGTLVPERDYWVVFQNVREDADQVITLTSTSAVIAETDRILVSDCQDLQEQVLRCRVAKTIMDATDRLEQRLFVGPEVSALVAEFKALPDFMLCRPLVLRMQAQLAEILDTAVQPPTPSALARMSSGGAYLRTQRGVTGDPEGHTFSSPVQQETSRVVTGRFMA